MGRNLRRELLLHGDSQTMRVLIVDYMDSALQVLSEMLTAMRFIVDVAFGGEQALRMVHAADAAGQPYDILVLDWQMPVLDGIQTAQRMYTLALQRPLRLAMLSRRMGVAIWWRRLPMRRMPASLRSWISRSYSPTCLINWSIYWAQRNAR